jgi:hypothetical protein
MTPEKPREKVNFLEETHRQRIINYDYYTDLLPKAEGRRKLAIGNLNAQ